MTVYTKYLSLSMKDIYDFTAHTASPLVRQLVSDLRVFEDGIKNTATE